MSLYILVKTGEDSGIRFKIQPGLKIGRKNADYIIKDTSASSLHAQIHKSSSGDYLLFDCKSKNGIKINGLREGVVPLKPGVNFSIGTTEFEVVKDLQDKTDSPLASSPPPPSSDNSDVYYGPPSVEMAPPPPNLENSKILEVEVVQRWNDILEVFSQEISDKIKNKPKTILPMNPALKLKFIRGIQTDTEWTLGYGPRKVGADEYDLTIFEPEAPALCFELIPTHSGVHFKTNIPDIVLYNGRACEQSLLKDGDLITFGNTAIRIELIK
ncbi:MAG: FHA domain-containing protein [Bdellovibrionaceae bacterium]|nr:FHA domain-containing protein [Pseudobdellovibrionaceae bacterium]